MSGPGGMASKDPIFAMTRSYSGVCRFQFIAATCYDLIAARLPI